MDQIRTSCCNCAALYWSYGGYHTQQALNDGKHKLHSPWHEAVQSGTAAKAANLSYSLMAHLLVRCSVLGSLWVLSGQLRLEFLQTFTLKDQVSISGALQLEYSAAKAEPPCRVRAADCAGHQRDPHAWMLPT